MLPWPVYAGRRAVIPASCHGDVTSLLPAEAVNETLGPHPEPATGPDAVLDAGVVAWAVDMRVPER